MQTRIWILVAQWSDERAIGFIHQIIGAIELLSLIGVGQNSDLCFRAERLHAPYVASCVSRHAHSTVRIQDHSIRAWLRPFEWLCTCVSAGVHENAHTLTRDPQVDVVCWDLGKQESSFVRPNRAFSPLVEAGGYALLYISGGTGFVEVFEPARAFHSPFNF